MRIKLSAGVVPKTGGQKIAGHPFAILSGLPNPSLYELLQFGHRSPNRPVVELRNAIILIQGHDRHTLWWSDREIEEDSSIGNRIPSRPLTNRIHPLAEFLTSRWIPALA